MWIDNTKESGNSRLKEIIGKYNWQKLILMFTKRIGLKGRRGVFSSLNTATRNFIYFFFLFELLLLFPLIFCLFCFCAVPLLCGYSVLCGCFFPTVFWAWFVNWFGFFMFACAFLSIAGMFYFMWMATAGFCAWLGWGFMRDWNFTWFFWFFWFWTLWFFWFFWFTLNNDWFTLPFLPFHWNTWELYWITCTSSSS